MKIKIAVIISAGVVLTVMALLFVFCKYEIYTTNLNTITSIKYFEPTEKKYAYHQMALTPVEYRSTPLTNSVVAKAIYKNDTIGFKIVKPRFKDKIYFKSIGKESDNFMKAISQLYEENDTNSSMRDKIESDFLMGGNAFDWNKDLDRYKISISALDGKEAEIYLDIDIPNHEIKIGDKNNGLSKQRFVNAFKNNFE